MADTLHLIRKAWIDHELFHFDSTLRRHSICHETLRFRKMKRSLGSSRSFFDLPPNQELEMLPTNDTIIFSLLPVEHEATSDSLLQAMADDDDFFFEPLPLERQETIYEDERISKTSVNEAMAVFMDGFQQREQACNKYYSYYRKC